MFIFVENKFDFICSSEVKKKCRLITGPSKEGRGLKVAFAAWGDRLLEARAFSREGFL